MDSYVIVLGPRKKAVESAYHVEIGEDDVVFLKKVASRKKQLYPDIAYRLIDIQRKEKRGQSVEKKTDEKKKKITKMKKRKKKLKIKTIFSIIK